MPQQVLPYVPGQGVPPRAPQDAWGDGSMETKDHGLYLEVPLPRHLYENGVVRGDTSVMRYMPSHTRHRVPPLRFGWHHHVRLAIVITMYAEPPEQLMGTLEGVANNITRFQRMQSRGDMWGLCWDEIVVVIVSDGYAKINEKTLRKCEELGLAKESLIFLAEYNGIMRKPEVQMHHFDAFVQLPFTESQKKKLAGHRHEPMQTILAIKEHNCGKLDSHKWFFDAYCAQLKPEFVVLLDCGTRPAENAIINLVGCMMKNVHIGGCCGEIAAEVSWLPFVSNSIWTNWVVAAQLFEYKLSHVMDKALESWIGFITVLPGAFSGYRYEALTGGHDLKPGDKSPLVKYFASLTAPVGKNQGAFDANMYLAEDRILCFAIVSMPHKHYTLHYEKNCVAVTDVPDDLTSLVKQRRRWLNGSFFAMLYALLHFYRIFTAANHGCLRKLAFLFQLMYYLLNVTITWFLPGSFYLSFYMLLQQTLPPGIIYVVVFYALTYMFLVTTGYAFLILAASGLIVWNAIRLGANVTVAVYITLVLLTFLFCSFLHGQMWYTLASLLQYYVLLPTFVMMFTIFSFCNIHDVSWGTKGCTCVALVGNSFLMFGAVDTVVKAIPSARSLRDLLVQPIEETAEADILRIQAEQLAQAARERKLRNELEAGEKARADEYKLYRTKFVVGMLASNWAYVTSVINFLFYTGNAGYYIEGLAASVGIMLGVRIVGSIAYQTERVLKRAFGRSYIENQEAEAITAFNIRVAMRGPTRM